MKSTFKFIVLVLLFFACNGDDEIVGTEPVNTRKNFAELILPSTTDAIIEDINENAHFVVFNELEQERNELLVFLGGTISKTGGASNFLDFAGDEGYHVISLAYPNLIPVRECRDKADIDCALNYRKEVFLGVEGSDLVTVDAINSIANRLQKLLVYLMEIDPNGNWQQYLNKEEILWDKIVIAGHSQGAGHAAFIANQINVKRSLMFAGPNDYSDFYDRPANWLSSPSQTPMDHYFAFLHLRDEAVNFTLQAQCLLALGFDTILHVDGNSSPFGGYNILSTDKQPSNQSGIGAPFHGSVVNDRFTPSENGRPVHSDVWKYMLGIN